MKIIISGATGAMGRVLAEMIEDRAEDQVVLGFSIEEEDGPFPILSKLPDQKTGDVLIDFSLPTALDEVLDYGVKTKTPLVLAVTGYTNEDVEKIKEAAKTIPILYSRNMSLGINIMEMVTKQLAKALAGFDIEIIESHHRYKKDSPSGTALMLFEAAKEGRGELEKLEGRAGDYDCRPASEVGISAIRGGTVVGEHSVLFLGEDEVVEIKHAAASKKVFAAGALRAAEFVVDQEPGLYNMGDVLHG